MRSGSPDGEDLAAGDAARGCQGCGGGDTALGCVVRQASSPSSSAPLVRISAIGDSSHNEQETITFSLVATSSSSPSLITEAQKGGSVERHPSSHPQGEACSRLSHPEVAPEHLGHALSVPPSTTPTEDGTLAPSVAALADPEGLDLFEVLTRACSRGFSGEAEDIDTLSSLCDHAPFRVVLGAGVPATTVARGVQNEQQVETQLLHVREATPSSVIVGIRRESPLSCSGVEVCPSTWTCSVNESHGETAPATSSVATDRGPSSVQDVLSRFLQSSCRVPLSADDVGLEGLHREPAGRSASTPLAAVPLLCSASGSSHTLLGSHLGSNIDGIEERSDARVAGAAATAAVYRQMTARDGSRSSSHAAESLFDSFPKRLSRCPSSVAPPFMLAPCTAARRVSLSSTISVEMAQPLRCDPAQAEGSGDLVGVVSLIRESDTCWNSQGKNTAGRSLSRHPPAVAIGFQGSSPSSPTSIARMPRPEWRPLASSPLSHGCSSSTLPWDPSSAIVQCSARQLSAVSQTEEGCPLHGSLRLETAAETSGLPNSLSAGSRVKSGSSSSSSGDGVEERTKGCSTAMVTAAHGGGTLSLLPLHHSSDAVVSPTESLPCRDVASPSSPLVDPISLTDDSLLSTRGGTVPAATAGELPHGNRDMSTRHDDEGDSMSRERLPSTPPYTDAAAGMDGPMSSSACCSSNVPPLRGDTHGVTADDDAGGFDRGTCSSFSLPTSLHRYDGALSFPAAPQHNVSPLSCANRPTSLTATTAMPSSTYHCCLPFEGHVPMPSLATGFRALSSPLAPPWPLRAPPSSPPDGASAGGTDKAAGARWLNYPTPTAAPRRSRDPSQTSSWVSAVAIAGASGTRPFEMEADAVTSSCSTPPPASFPRSPTSLRVSPCVFPFQVGATGVGKSTTAASAPLAPGRCATGAEGSGKDVRGPERRNASVPLMKGLATAFTGSSLPLSCASPFSYDRDRRPASSSRTSRGTPPGTHRSRALAPLPPFSVVSSFRASAQKGQDDATYFGLEAELCSLPHCSTATIVGAPSSADDRKLSPTPAEHRRDLCAPQTASAGPSSVPHLSSVRLMPPPPLEVIPTECSVPCHAAHPQNFFIAPSHVSDRVGAYSEKQVGGGERQAAAVERVPLLDGPVAAPPLPLPIMPSPATHFQFAFSSLRGCRRRQEDSVMIVPDFAVSMPATRRVATATGGEEGGLRTVPGDGGGRAVMRLPTFGVFDGHCGDAVASSAAQHFPEHFEEAMRSQDEQHPSDSLPLASPCTAQEDSRAPMHGHGDAEAIRAGKTATAATNAFPSLRPTSPLSSAQTYSSPSAADVFQRRVSAALVQALLHLDLTLRDVLYEGSHGEASQPHRNAGSTACVVALFRAPSQSNTSPGLPPSVAGLDGLATIPKVASRCSRAPSSPRGTYRLCIANLGDSRAIVGSLLTGEVLLSTADHRIATYPPEQARIEAARGHVELGRIDGCLDVTRGLGDYRYKVPPSQWWSCTAPSPATAVKGHRHCFPHAHSATTPMSAGLPLTTEDPVLPMTLSDLSHAPYAAAMRCPESLASTPRCRAGCACFSAARALCWRSSTSTLLSHGESDVGQVDEVEHVERVATPDATCRVDKQDTPPEGGGGRGAQHGITPSSKIATSASNEDLRHRSDDATYPFDSVSHTACTTLLSRPRQGRSLSSCSSSTNATPATMEPPPLRANAVSNIADVYEWEVHCGEVLVVASDGVWDRMSSAEVLNFVRQALAERACANATTARAASDADTRERTASADDPNAGAAKAAATPISKRSLREEDAAERRVAFTPERGLRSAPPPPPPPPQLQQQQCGTPRPSVIRATDVLCTPGGCEDDLMRVPPREEGAEGDWEGVAAVHPPTYTFSMVQAVARRLTEHVVHELSGGDNTTAVVVMFD